MNLVSTSLLNAVAVSIRMLSMLVLNKILAIYVGPSGYALMGQLQNAVTTLTALASAGVGTGVTKYTAEYAQDTLRQRIIWGTAGTTGFVVTAILATILTLFHRTIAGAVLKDEAYGDVFLWVAACLLLFALNSLLLAILNGKKEIRLFVFANIANSLFALLVTGLLAWLYGLYGALIALAVNQSLSCFLTLWLCRRTAWFRLQDLFCWPDKEALRRLSHYTLMALATSVIGPLALMLVRNILLSRFGSDSAGYWEALTRISNLYLMFITTPLSVYYLPKLAELHEKRDLRREIVQGYRLLIPAAMACALTVFVLRDRIVNILFSADFLPLRDLFLWQMVGDVLRIAAWLLSFFLLSKSMTGIFLATEILFSSTFVLFSWYGSEMFGLQGVPIAYALNQAMYVVVVGYLVYKKLSEKISNLYSAEK
jgi:PST family polysaccharide transporter